MEKEQLGYFKDIILKKRKKLVEELDSIRENATSDSGSSSGDSTYAYHMADVGTDAQEREKAFLWLARENKYLSHLNAALERIESGEYGHCASCGEQIKKERLEEVPHTTHCVACKNKERR
ncbi:MAG: RNA polymerase-binding transcription factor DksA [Candidatus Marinimicrobia bacterium]|nr:RNA polymerase-binding transcription factor DksA [Candidatus Neomarinimicrobiota bacterium]